MPRAVVADCPDKVIDQADLAARGAHAIYLKDGAIEIVDAAATIGERPWRAPAQSITDAGLDQ
jgi:competence protein ComEC